MAQGFYNNEGEASPGDDSQHPVEVDKVQANIFFDGTLNNFYNSVEQVTSAIARFEAMQDTVALQAMKTLQQKFTGKDTSYDNSMSNIARMWEPMGQEPDHPDIGVYLDGMGTTQYEADSLSGYAFGMGHTGMVDRAQEAFGKLKETVGEKRKKQGLPAILELNVFGFSRGAATARHFVSLLGKPEVKVKHFNKTWRGVIVQVNFVGLFDTVSSEGVYYGNDVADLELRFAKNAARRVFHLVALDEYRENFSGTTIASARNATSLVDGAHVPMGFELGIPGAHSDVGGGYTCDSSKSEQEIRKLPSTHTQHMGRGQTTTVRGPQAFVYAQGWYTAKQRKEGDMHTRLVTGDYAKVALSLMVDMAEQHTTARYAQVRVQAQTPDIEPVQAQLRALLKQSAFVPGKPTRMDWSLDEHLGPEAAQAFRNKYLHLSLNPSKTGMGPRYKDNQTLERHHEAG
jgi:hypothetical protein